MPVSILVGLGGLPFSLGGLMLGGVSLAKRRAGRRMAKAGVACSVVGIALMLATIALVYALRSANVNTERAASAIP